MKEKLLKGLFGFVLIMLSFFVLTDVNAETVGEDGTINAGWSNNGHDENYLDVKVGEVDVPVYSASLTWTSMEFDYKYNEETYSYEWVNHNNCTKMTVATAERKEQLENRLYDDASCTVEYTGNVNETIDAEEVYYKTLGGLITIEDHSKYGFVEASISWTPSEKYEGIKMLAEYTSSHHTPVDEINSGDDLVPTTRDTFSPCSYYEDGYCYGSLGYLSDYEFKIPYYSRIDNTYRLKISVNNELSTMEEKPSQGDAIGQLTIKLSANE